MENAKIITLILPLLFCAGIAGAWPQEFLRTVDKAVSAANYEKAWGLNPKWQKRHYSRNEKLQVYLIKSSAPATILWPGDRAEFTFQFTNLTDQPVKAQGKLLIIQYQIITRPGTNVFDIGVRKVRDIGSTPIAVDIPAGGWQNVTVKPEIPAAFGGYAGIIALAGQDRLFGATCVRTFKPTIKPRRFYKLTMDLGYIPALLRLGATVNRMGMGYKPTTDKGFEDWYKRKCQYLEDLKAAGLPVTVEFGAGAHQHEYMPLGRGRPWLDDNDRMKRTKQDLSWLPAYDADFETFVKRLLADYGWPKGPVNAVMLWNEPWNGMSISGWGADDERYREIYTAMARGVEAAEKEAGVDVWIGGCDSSSNTFDKLFGDGTDKYLKWLDFMSIHYQGTHPCTTVKRFNNRRLDGKPAPVEVWDTESWVANSDDRIAGVLAAMYSFGQKRVVGINSDCMVTAYQKRKVKTAAGVEDRVILQTWSAGAAVGAFQHFVGERDFRRLLFRPGLPFVMQFDGEPAKSGKPNPEDGTIVILGDMGAVFGIDNVAFYNCRSAGEVRRREELIRKLKALPNASPERAALEKEYARKVPYAGAAMTIKADRRYNLYDFYGNKVSARNDTIVVPLDARGFYLRGDGRPGSFAALVAAVQAGRIDGLEPLHKVCRDMTRPIAQKPTVRLELTNILNRPVTGTLQVTLGKLSLDYPQTVSFRANQSKTIEVKITGGKANPANRYPLALVFDAGKDGKSVHYEPMRVNCIRRQTITVDGKLDDWQEALPQQIKVEGVQQATLTEKAWLPFNNFDESIKKGLAVGYVAYDDKYFYFGAKITDTTPHPGTVRFETRDDSEYFYPEVCYAVGGTGRCAGNFSVRWTGTVTAPKTDEYTVWIRSDDGVRLWLNGKLVIDDWRGHPPTRNEAPKMKLRQGERVKLKLEYFQGGGAGMIQLGWEGAKTRGRVIGADRFRTSAGKPGLQAEYYHGTGLKKRAQTRIDARVNFSTWPGEVGDKDFGIQKPTPLHWPQGVRRFSYRKGPVLPSGNAPNFDNIQLGFNVLSRDEKPWAFFPPGTVPYYTGYWDTDYEYALNTVAATYGGGVEIWRIRYPGMPPKHHYPRQPACEQDGPVKNGKLVTKHEGSTRITECALPWGEIPHVKQALDAGRPIKFSFKINDSAGVGCMELSKGRSVARRNGSFRADWKESWANELEFGWEKP